METDACGRLGVEEVTLHDVAHILAKLLPCVTLCDDSFANGFGNIASIDFLFN